MHCVRSAMNRRTRRPAEAGDVAVERMEARMPMPPLAARAAGRRKLLAAVCLAIGTLSACGDDSPTAPGPGPLPIEGRWTGGLTDRSAGAGTLDVSVGGPGEVGAFTLTLADASGNVQGAVLARAATAQRTELTLNVTSASRDCPGVPGVFYTANVTVSGNRMTGAYEPAIGCPLLRGGTLELTRR